MRVLIQWAKDNPEGWEEFQIPRVQEWRQLPNKGLPTSPDQPVDSQSGWINAINIQGVIFTGYDKYSLAQSGAGIAVFAWQDSADFPPGTRWASLWTFLSPAPDQRIGGRINTRQTRLMFAEPGAELPPGLPVLPWNQFQIPNQNTHRFGKWLSNELFLDHLDALPRVGWREWIE